MEVDEQGPAPSTSQSSSAYKTSTSALRRKEPVHHQLEDSFKFAVGIAPSHGHNGLSRTSPRRKSPGAGSKAGTNNIDSEVDERTTSVAASPSLRHASFDEVPEEVLLRDVLYAMQAIDSKHIFFDTAADRFQITRHVGVPTRTCLKTPWY
jgi:hypothetical protein